MNGGLNLSVTERRWLKENEGSAQSYLKIKNEIVQSKFGSKKRDTKTIVAFGSHAMVLVRLIGLQKVEDRLVTADDIRSATIACVTASMTATHSLAGLGRGSRKKKAATKPIKSGYGACKNICVAANQLGKYLAVPSFEPLNWADIHDEASEDIVDTSALEMPSVQDVLSIEEMERTVQCSTNVKERLILLLLSRLAMRIGAIQQLRLSGVLESETWDKLMSGQGPPTQWFVRRYITGKDKGKRMNTWDTMLSPDVHAALNAYIVEWWRPRHEYWVKNDKGKEELSTAWLFPGSFCGGSMHECDFSARYVVPALRRAGLNGPNAHTHAFRKGVITALRRAGNSIEDVSVFAHHESSKTTDESYVFIPYSEAVQRLRIPDAWLTTNSHNPETDATSVDEMVPVETEQVSTVDESNLMEQCGECFVELAKKIDCLEARERMLVEVLRRILPTDILTTVEQAWSVALSALDDVSIP